MSDETGADGAPTERSVAEMLSRLLVEVVDNNAHLMTVLDVQALILSQVQMREHETIVDEINEMLKARRRDAIASIEEWATGLRTSFEEDADGGE